MCRDLPPPRSALGFTLLELMLVLLLLGLAYGLAGPLIGDRPTGMELQNAASQILAGMRKARTVAIAEHRDAALSLDVAAKTFSVTGDPRAYVLPKSLDYTLFTADSEVIKNRVGSIRFFPDGSSTGGRVTTSSSGGASRSIDIDWLTGHAILL